MPGTIVAVARGKSGGKGKGRGKGKGPEEKAKEIYNLLKGGGKAAKGKRPCVCV
jgi:hypothetical protein